MDLNLAVILFVCLQFFKVLAENLEEGSLCQMENGIKGICLKLSDCPHAQEEIKNLRKPKYCQYGIFTQPLVCCLDCQFIKSRFLDGMSLNMSFDFLFDLRFTDSSKIKQQRCLRALKIANLQKFPCNEYEQFQDLHHSVMCYDIPNNSDDIVDEGFDATNIHSNHNHHLALIGYGDHPDEAKWLCSGSVISKKHILTAAHCTTKSPELGPIKFTALGVAQSMDNQNNWQIYGVVKIIIHPGYVPPSKYNDIALLETGNQIMFNRDVLPACLYRGHEVGIFATAIGWRAKQPSQQNSTMDILRGTMIKKFPDAQCFQAYPRHRHLSNGFISASQVCFGDQDHPNDSCEGDSGGPLQVRNFMKNSMCLYTIVGVTSFGRACGNFGTPGLFTKVSFYLPWIESITGRLG